MLMCTLMRQLTNIRSSFPPYRSMSGRVSVAVLVLPDAAGLHQSCWGYVWARWYIDTGAVFQHQSAGCGVDHDTRQQAAAFSF